MDTPYFTKLPIEIQNHICRFLPEHSIIKNVLSPNMCIFCSSKNNLNKNPHPKTIIYNGQTTDQEFGDLYCQHTFCDICIGFNNILPKQSTKRNHCILCKHDISLIVSDVSNKLEYEADELAEYLINKSLYYADDFRRVGRHK